MPNLWVQEQELSVAAAGYHNQAPDTALGSPYSGAHLRSPLRGVGSASLHRAIFAAALVIEGASVCATRSDWLQIDTAGPILLELRLCLTLEVPLGGLLHTQRAFQT